MRPLKIKMTAFGPYAGTQIIDFRPLNKKSFFLIHGPTGAGKTTILDAICFALYGETSGDERKCEQMRSHHAINVIDTEVTLDFMLGEKYYRVIRNLKQKRMVLNQSGKEFKSDKATLWQYSKDDFEQSESRVLASGLTKVNEKIEELLGFKSNQFRKVILLPQDQFQKLLKANSQEREDIFKTLFQTDKYEQIEQYLKNEAKTINDRLKEIKNNIDFILSTAHVSNLEELTEKKKGLAYSLATEQSELLNLRNIETLAAENLAQGLDIQKKIDEKKQAETNLQLVVSRKNEFNEKRNKYLRAQKTTALLDLEIIVKQRQKEADGLQSKCDTAQSRLKIAENEQLHAAENLDNEIKRDQERINARKECEHLEAIAENYQKLEEAQCEFNRVQQQASLVKRKRDDVFSKMETLTKSLKDIEFDLTRIEESTRNFYLSKQIKDEAQQIKEKWDRLRGIAINWKTAQGEEENALSSLKDTDNKLIHAREKRNNIDSLWYAGQASILAGQLVDNTPCPVCGSVEHPQPAISEINPPSESEREEAQIKVSELENQYQVIQSQYSELHDKTVRLNAERIPLVEDLQEKAHWNRNQVEEGFQSAQLAYRQAEAEDKRLASIKQKVEPAKKQLAEAENNYSGIELEWQDALIQLSSAQAILLEREKSVPPDLRNKQILFLEQKNANEKLSQLTNAFEQAQKNDQKARQELTSSEATYEQISVQVAGAKQLADEISKEFQSRMLDAGFLDIDDYRSAKLSTSESNLLDKKIREYEGQLSAAKSRVERAIELAKSLIEPDEKKLRDEDYVGRLNVETKIKIIQQLESDEKLIKSQLRQLTQIQKEFNYDEELFKVIGKIADVANGKNPYNLTFHRFVLSALLEEVLNDSSKRLNVMSRGRYILQRAQSPLDKRKGSGLDLVISDTWTGDSTRPVETLSGGEGFYTSLALALGLAEVVQRYAGGIRLDTIFIDEGFGSLDADTLDLAIKTLEGLRENGRLVGIISHVESLKERIPTRLEVTASTKGSKVDFLEG